MIYLESLSKISVRNSELEQFSHRPHDAVGDFYLFVQIIEKSLPRSTGLEMAGYQLSKSKKNVWKRCIILILKVMI